MTTYGALTEFLLMVFGIAKVIVIPCVLANVLFKIPGFNEAFEKFFKLDVED